jgi:hypothetical protein
MTLFDAASEAQRKADAEYLDCCFMCGSPVSVEKAGESSAQVWCTNNQCGCRGGIFESANTLTSAMRNAREEWNRIYTLVTKEYE